MNSITHGHRVNTSAEAEPKAPGGSLTQRETEIVAHLVQGKSLSEIATEVHRSIETIKTHCRSLMRKLGARNRADVIRIAYQNGLATPWSASNTAEGTLPTHLWSIVTQALVQGPIPLAVFSPRLQVLYQTDAFAHLFVGSSTQQTLFGILRGASFVEDVDTDDPAGDASEHESRRLSVRLPGPVTVELTCTPLRSDSGGLQALLVTARDMTELFNLHELTTTMRLASEASSVGRDRELESLRKTAALEIARRTRHESRLAEVFAALTPASGADFFAELARRFRASLEAHIVAICERPASTSDHPTILAAAGPEKTLGCASELRGHAVRSLVGSEVVHHASGVAGLFHDDPLVTRESIEAALSVPIVGRDGVVLGAIVVLDRAPRPEIADIMPLLRLAASRAAIEIESRAAVHGLRASQSRLRIIDDANPVPMIQLDGTRAAIAHNSAFQSLVAPSRQFAPARSWREHLAPDEAQRLDDVLASMSPARPHASLMLPLRSGDSGALPVRVEIGASFGPGGAPIGFVLAFVRAA